MISASPYVIIENVRESVDYYQSVFGGEIKVLNEHNGKLLHAELHLGSSLIHFSDDYGRGAKTANVSIIMALESEEELRAIYGRLVEDGGKVQVELQKTFFGALHGQVSDVKNGITWVFNYFAGN
ncbi:VOC family protein [Paenibacillus typhae]|uniref:VOC family protein n=1 Tax=Paenibacillus typhae TaxID=1174501 RepID=UPI001C8E1F00|nr:glyoxalase/bleomycin resistance/extradiol dioxygenase family protein [Paenibacillus typhae]MBY0009067.1 glyoxalase/bleomycin resistance/extradiol dioxygenase family protein [Paenibacillus typhae]